MDIQISDPTNADPMSVVGDVLFEGDDDRTCVVTLPIDSPVYARLMMSGLRAYRISMSTGPGTSWSGTMTRWRIGGNRVYLTCDGHIDYVGDQ